jgi:Protein of unknown function (DUF2281)
MLTSVRGIYENGSITLLERPLISNKTEVIVTFTEEIKPIKKRKLGGLEGKIHLSNDFDEPLDDLKEYMF